MLDINDGSDDNDPTWNEIMLHWAFYKSLVEAMYSTKTLEEVSSEEEPLKKESLAMTAAELLETVRETLIEKYGSYKESISALVNPFSQN